MKKLSRLFTVILAVVLMLTMVSATAETTEDTSTTNISVTLSITELETEDESIVRSTSDDLFEEIIGSSDELPESRIPNCLVVDWDATATQIIIYVSNIGVDTVDLFSGTVTVEGGSSVSFTTLSIAPLTTRTITVTVNMQQCYESIVVDYYAVDGGTEFGEGSSPGHREIPSSLSSLWTQGSFSTLYGSIDYHYSKHGSEVGTTNIVDYATKASSFRADVLSDLSSMTSEELNDKYKITTNSGTTSSHKYKNKTSSIYTILSDTGYYIVSYGK